MTALWVARDVAGIVAGLAAAGIWIAVEARAGGCHWCRPEEFGPDAGPCGRCTAEWMEGRRDA